MVKSGEVHKASGEVIVDILGYMLSDEALRPRGVKLPDEKGFGILQALFSTFWPALKEVFPEFIHSYTKK